MGESIGARSSEPEETAADLGDVAEAIEAFLLGGPPTLTRVEVAERAGVPLELAGTLWRQLGFPHHADDDVAFAESDVEALRLTADLVRMGILSPSRRPPSSAPGAAATPAWPSGRSRCWPGSPSRAATRPSASTTLAGRRAAPRRGAADLRLAPPPRQRRAALLEDPAP